MQQIEMILTENPETIQNIETRNKKPKFFCEKCFYETNVKQRFTNHLNSKRHLSENNYNFECICHKRFQTQTGLWKHKMSCKKHDEQIPKNESVNPNEILSTIKEMVEKQDKIETLIKNQKPTTTSTSINNGIITNNNIVLLNFLNTNYNDVITFEEFIRSITLNYKDIEYMMKDNKEKDIVRWIECLNQVIIDRLKQYKVSERPIHCIQDDEYNYEAFLKNSEWIKEYVKDFDDKTPILEEKVLIFLAKINQDIDNMMLENETKLNLKKILKNITKKDQLKMMKEELFNGIHINKYELNYNLLDDEKNRTL